jgi:predicted nucleotidyltransferase
MGSPPVRVDVLTGIPGVTFEEAWVRRVEILFDDLKVNFISKEDLIAAKLAAGRPQDLLDAEKLSGTKTVKRTSISVRKPKSR